MQDTSEVTVHEASAPAPLVPKPEASAETVVPAAGKRPAEVHGKGPSQTPPRPAAAESSGMSAEAVLQRIEGMHKKLLAQQMTTQANTLKGLREDMRKETKRIEAATQAQVPQRDRSFPRLHPRVLIFVIAIY